MIFVCTAIASPKTAKAPERNSGAEADAQRHLQSIASLASPLHAEYGRSAVLRGVVTLVRKRIVYVQDQTGAIPVVPPEPVRLAIGDEVEMEGEYRPWNSSAALYPRRIRRLWSGSPPVPLSLKPVQAAEGSFASQLIDTEGRLLQKTVGRGYLRLTLEGDHQLFGASLELSSPVTGSTELAKSVEEGSILRLVGVAAQHPMAEETVGNAFVILLRSTDDIRVVTPPPWWNLTHAAWLGCAAVILLSAFYRFRHRALNSRFEAIVEERGRIAREMHDTLAQGFSGLTYQLEGLAQELEASGGANTVDRHLTMALQLVRHCREEAHRSIFALRSLTQTNPDLLALLLSSCDPMRTRTGVEIRPMQGGKPVRLPDEVINQLLRIGQEALTNAFQHSGATEIGIALQFGSTDVTLRISDNGAGFDTGYFHPAEAGHFGILGMSERAKRINAVFRIESSAGAGTVVSVRVPLQARNFRLRNVNWQPWFLRFRSGSGRLRLSQ